MIRGLDDEGWIDFYEQGGCHILAMALQEHFKDYRFRVFMDPFDSLGEDAHGDPIPSIIHIYALVARPEGDIALDVSGARPADEAEQDVLSRYSYGVVSYEDMTLQNIRTLIRPDEGDGWKLDLPLRSISDVAMDRARHHVSLMIVEPYADIPHPN